MCVIVLGGRVIPTELRADALELRKAMKYDDPEREGDSNCITRAMIYACVYEVSHAYT